MKFKLGGRVCVGQCRWDPGTVKCSTTSPGSLYKHTQEIDMKQIVRLYTTLQLALFEVRNSMNINQLGNLVPLVPKVYSFHSSICSW